jgi:uncharacterized protein with HEPN domain
LKKTKLFLGHINDVISYLLNRSKDIDYEYFIDNDDLIRSFARSLEIIGEAAKNIPISFRKKYRMVEWKEMAG